MKFSPTAGAVRINPYLRKFESFSEIESKALEAIYARFPESAGLGPREFDAEVLYQFQLEFSQHCPLNNVCADFVIADNPGALNPFSHPQEPVVLFAYGLAGETPHACFSKAKGQVSLIQDPAIAVAEEGVFIGAKTAGLAIMNQGFGPESTPWVPLAAKSATYKAGQVKDSLVLDLYKAEKALVKEIKASICLQSISSPLVRRLSELGLDAAKRDKLNHHEFLAMLKQPNLANLLYPIIVREMPGRLGLPGQQLIAIKGPGLVPGGTPRQAGSYVYINQKAISRVRIVP